MSARTAVAPGTLPARPARMVALALLALLGWHASTKVDGGLLPEMLWACHLATATCAVGLLLLFPRVAVLGGLFHLGCGFAGWLLEVAVHGTTLSSFGVHVATPLAGLWAAAQVGVPRWLPAFGAVFWVAAQGVGRLCPEALNVNVAWRPFDALPAGTPLWGSHLLNLSLVVASMRIIVGVAGRLGALRER